MHPQQIQLVRSTYTLVAPGSAYIAATFYRRLFELEPALPRDEGLAVAAAARDSVTLHRLARRQRSRMLGELLARAAGGALAAIGRAVAALVPRSHRRHARPDVI